MHPDLKVHPKGSWRRSGAAPATTRAPYKHRAAKREAAGAKPALPMVGNSPLPEVPVEGAASTWR
eukprot:scaffold121045_cov54-Phaeocystis_antarctica.AAC.2